MTSERDSNRLPLRAGAMLLLAIAVVFFGLGVHRLATSPGDEEPAAPAAQSAPQNATTQPTESTPATTAASGTKVCVVNAGNVTGLAGALSRKLRAKGYKTAEPANMSSSTLSENTIFFRDGDETAANQVATDLGGGYSVEARPAAATKLPACTNGVLVIAVTE